MEERLARRLLALLVLTSFVVRTGLAWLQATPVYLPDEYMYSALSRSIATSGRPLVRGGSAHLPALLAPLLDAPAWVVGGVATGYRLAQTEQELAISLTALPVYWLARRLEVGRRSALVAATLALVVPDLVFGSFLLSEAFALPLFVAAVAAGVAALDQGQARRWLGFAALALLATSARLQFVVVVPLVLAAGSALELRRSRARAAGRLAVVLLVTVTAVAGAAATLGTSRLLGVYDGLLHAGVAPSVLLRWMSFNGIVLAAATGWVVVPGALLSLAVMLARPRTRSEEAFAALTGSLLVVLLAQGALFAEGGIQVMERYTFYASPLLIVAFACAAQRGLLRTRAHAALAFGLAALGLFLPHFPELFVLQADHAPSLLAYGALDELLGWRAALVVGGTAAALGATALALGRSGRGHALFALASVVCIGLLAGAHVRLYDVAAAAVRAQGGSLAFADQAGAHDASYLMFADTPASNAQEAAFWNRSIVRVLRLDQAGGDGFPTLRATLAPSGRLLVAGRPLDRPLVVDLTSAFVRFDRPPLARTRTAELVGPDARLRELVDGYLSHGRWLGTSGRFAAWPAAPGKRTHGSVVLRLWGGHRSVLRLTGPGCAGIIRVPRAPITVRLPFDARGPWSCRFEVDGPMGIIGAQVVTVHARLVRFATSAA